MSIVKPDIAGMQLQKSKLFDNGIPDDTKIKKNSVRPFLALWQFPCRYSGNSNSYNYRYHDKVCARQSSSYKIFRDGACEPTGQLLGIENKSTSFLLGGTKYALSRYI